MRRGIPFVAAALTACTSPVIVAPADLVPTPAALRWVAIETASGPSALYDLDRETLAVSVPGDETFRVLGWNRTNLVAPFLSSLPDGDRALRPAVGCEYRLPPPDVAAAGDDVPLTPVPTATVALTGDWLVAGAASPPPGGAPCPVMVPEPISASLTHTSQDDCGVEIVQRQACRVSVSLRDDRCGRLTTPPELALRTLLDAAGTLCTDASASMCTPTGPREDQATCTLAQNPYTLARLEAAPAGPALRVVTGTVSSVSAQALEASNWEIDRIRDDGKVGELVILDGVAVAFDHANLSCTASLHVLDRDTLLRIGSPRPWNRCNTIAVRERGGNRIIAVWDQGDGRYEIGRIDPMTFEVTSQLLYRFPVGAIGEPERVRTVDILYAGTRLAVVFSGTPRAGDTAAPRNFSYTFLLDATTLQPLPGFPSRKTDRGIRAAVEFQGLALVDDVLDRVYVHPVGDRREAFEMITSTITTAGGTRDGGLQMGNPTVAGGFLVLPIPGGVRGIYRSNMFASLALNTRIYAFAARPTVAVPWPADPRLLLVAATSWSPTDPERMARLFFVELDAQRVLSRPKSIAHGVVTRMRTVEGSNAVWLLMPLTGAIVRVAPAA